MPNSNDKPKDEEKTQEVELVHPTPWGEQIAEAFGAHEQALARSKENKEARAESVVYWDGVAESLAELKRRVEHVEDSPIRDSKLWAILASVDTTRTEPEG